MHPDRHEVCPLCKNSVTELVQHHWFIGRTGYIVIICGSCNSSLGKIFSSNYPNWEDQVKELKKHFRVFSHSYPDFDFESTELPEVFEIEVEGELTKGNLIKQLGLVSIHYPREYSLVQNQSICNFWNSDADLTLAEVGKKFHITGARVGQILREAGLPSHRLTKEQDLQFRKIESTLPSKGKVKCELCGYLFLHITPTHLRYEHGTTTDKYIKDFPSALLVGISTIGETR